MATLLGTVIADFTTSLATALAVGGTSVTLQSATDDDGVALPTGRYFLTIDGGNSSKEHISCTLTGTSLTSIKSVSRQGAETSGVARAHRIGATVVLTDFAHMKYMNDLLAGTTTFNAAIPLGYDGTASITTPNQFATKAYADALAIAGAPNATTSVQGLVELATQTEIEAGTATGATGATLMVPNANYGARFYGGYAADAGSNDTYVITLSPVPIAYNTGMVIVFKANTVNTGAATINVNSLGAKDIRRNNGLVLANGDIAANQFTTIVYNGTYFELQSPIGRPQISTNGSEIYALDAVGTDSYAVTLAPAPTAYTTGMVVRFKAGTANTGACTLAVNGLTATSIVKDYNTALVTGDILQNQIVEVVYDGTNFQVLSQLSGIVGVALASGTVSDNNAVTTTTGGGTNTDTTVTHGLGRTPKAIVIAAEIQGAGTTNSSYISGSATYDASGTLISSNWHGFNVNGALTSSSWLRGTNAQMSVAGVGGFYDTISISALTIGATTFVFRINGVHNSSSGGTSTVRKITWYAI